MGSTAGNRAARWVAVVAAAGLMVTACGGDDDASPAGDGAAEPAGADDADAGGGGDGGGPSSGGSGELVLGAETIALEMQCFLQEQDAAAGGGKILFVAQGRGTNAAGEDVLLDVSRYDEDSQFVGDDVLVDIGDVFSGEAVSWSSGGEIGTVTVDGSTVSADGLTFTNFDDFSEQPGSFELNC